MPERSSFSPRLDPIVIAAAILVAVRIAAVSLPELRLWGIDFHRFLSWPATVYSVLLVAAIAFAGRAAKGFVMDAGRSLPILLGVVLLLLLGIALFPMETFYYGDGGPLIAEIYKIGAREHYTSAMVLNLQSAPLAGGLLHLFTTLIPGVMHTLGMTLPETPMFPFLALGLFGALALGAAMFAESDARLRLPIFLLMLGSGGVILFFRYAEMYLPVFIAVTAYLLAASAVLRRERPLWLAALLFAIAVAAHYMSLALLPSLLFLFFRDTALVRRFTGTPRALAASFAGMLAAAFALYFLLGFQHSDSRVVMPMYPVETPAGTLTYTLFSSYHLVDLANLLLLIGPLPLLLILADAVTGRLESRKKGRSQGKLGKDVRAAAGGIGPGTILGGMPGNPLRFQLIAGYSFLLFLFFANTSLGLARDWDIAAPLGAMLVMVFVELRRGRSAERGMPRGAADLLKAGIVAVLLAVPWIAANVNVAASTARFEEVMRLDDEHMYGDYALSGYEALRKQVLHAADYHREGEVLKRMIEVVGYPEQYRMLLTNAVYHADKDARRYFELNDWMLGRLGEKAAALRAAGSEHDYAIGLKQIDSLAAVMAIESITYGHWREMHPRFERFSQQSRCLTAENILKGTTLYGEQKYGQGIPIFAAIREADFRDSRIDGMYGSCLYIAGDRMKAETEFREGLSRYGKNPQYLFMIATAYLQRDGRFDDVRALLERALTLDPPDDARAQITSLLEEVSSFTRKSASITESTTP